ncbi:phenylacetyl-CoA ligase [Guyanagaster necrorhizus]|uniref:Phenylacetyl-CoA ligase n=1 Tax=Guyanagaster necrorhizus TaxID=856835 RepID=A0A9P7VNZ3_9AGAR|nr:phenylacetyl-CoA ligase [Guyanagaster necrorhizus MCA 3950]KAG7444137.1 phenylacetyl-CoA ligase [Guyanagaster necrorhizus MCA 3950]
MPDFYSKVGSLPHVPDDLTIPQFILDYAHPIRPERPNGVPWLVTDRSGRKIHLDEIQRRTNGLAVGLKEKFSIGSNDPVLFFSTNHVDYPVCMWAVHRILGIVTPCNPSLTVPELVKHLRLSKSSLIIAHVDFLDTVCAAAREVGLSTKRIIVLPDQDSQTVNLTEFVSVDDLVAQGLKSHNTVEDVKLAPGEGKERIAFYSSSSGTTGEPKIVQISHYAFIANVLQIASLNKVNEEYDDWEKRRYRSGDACLAVLPFYHIYGLVLILHFNIFSAMAVIVVPKFNLKEMLQSIVKYRISSLMVVPPQVVLLCKNPIVNNFDLSSVRAVLCAAAPLTAELYDQLGQLLPNICIGQAYGSTEATGVVSMCPVEQKCGMFGGVLAPGVVGRVVKADGTLGDYDEEGELYIRTPAAATGYLNNDAATRDTFADGWIRSGDLVKVDKNHEVIFIDRLKEIIKVRGFQVAPAELEGCILDHPFVGDVCVVGIPHAYSGEVPLAFVVLTADGMNTAEKDGEGIELCSSPLKHVADNKASFKHLHQVEITDAIPKTPSGKLLRRELREKARSLAQSAKL